MHQIQHLLMLLLVIQFISFPPLILLYMFLTLLRVFIIILQLALHQILLFLLVNLTNLLIIILSSNDYKGQGWHFQA